MSQIRFRDKVVDSSCATENRQQKTDAAAAVPKREAKANPSPESSEEDRDSTVTACTGNDAIRNQEHDAGKHFRRARYSQSGCCQDCQRNSLTLSPRSSRQWRCRRKPIAANVRRSCRSEGDQQSEINLTRGKQQDCDSVEQQLSVQDPIGSKSKSPTVSTKTVKNQRSEELQQIRG